MPGMLGEAGVGGWVWCVGRGENPAGMSTNNSGDKPPPPESWAPPPNRGTPLSEASSDPCMAVTERLPQRDHPWTQEGNPCALHRCFGVWLFCLLVPPFQQSTQENSFPTPGAAEAGGAGDRGSEKVERLGDARWEGARGWREWVWAEGESGGEGREGERKRVGGRESWVQWEGEGVGGGEGGGARTWDSASSPRETPAGLPKTLRHGHVALGFKVPALGGCPQVRASEPAGGTYPAQPLSRPCPRVHTGPVRQQRPVPSVSLSDPSSQYGVTDLALPPASSRHAQMYRRSLLANPSPNEGLDPLVSKSIRTPCLFPCEPPWWV